MNSNYNPDIPVAVALVSEEKGAASHYPSDPQPAAVVYAVASTPNVTVVEPAPSGAVYTTGSVVSPAPQKLPSVQNDGSLREFLQNKGWTNSMQDFFVQSLERIPLRYFICDDSGSMGIADGEKIATYGNQKK